VVCVIASDTDREIIASAIDKQPELDITIDVENHKIWYGDQSVPCEIKPGARDSLLSGNYDPLDELLVGADEVSQTAGALPYMQS
jgi:3-isopropylmalate/(R)-2-methylmalate dehydratase small subunit